MCGPGVPLVVVVVGIRRPTARSSAAIRSANGAIARSAGEVISQCVIERGKRFGRASFCRLRRALADCSLCTHAQHNHANMCARIDIQYACVASY